jgi:outer membrane receptor for ferrienterochelin and colicin
MVACIALIFAVLASPAAGATPANGDVSGTVTDSMSGNPLQGVEVAVEQGTAVVTVTTTDPFGRYRLHNIPNGPYTIIARFIGYQPQTRPLTISGDQTVNFHMVVAPASLQQVAVTAQAPVSVDTRSGDQTYTQNDAHYTPTTTTSQVVQQAIAGAARAPTGEVHIRGQHAEYTYYVDGIPVTSGVSGSLNELFDPSVVQRIDFATGAWDAAYGEKNAAIINIQTRVPAGAFHADESTYFGSYNSLGQSLSLSSNQGKFAWFASGTAQGTDMRREPVEGTANNTPINFSNHGDDYFGFTKFQYTATDRDIISLDGNYSMSFFQIPYDTAIGTAIHDHETDVNDFINLSYRHRFGNNENTAERGMPNELFLGGFFRNGGLQYRPGSTDVPTYVDANDPTQTPRDVFEDRKFSSVGLKADYGFPVVSGVLDGQVGVLTSRTFGHENFQLIDPTGKEPNIGSNSGLTGDDFAAYVETSVRPAEWFELRTGVRFNSHVAPFAGNQEQWSPRIRANFFPDASNTMFLYFGRQFMPTNIEDLRSITLASGGGSVAASATLPDRSAFYEAAWLHRFPLGFVTKVDGYWIDETPGIDDNTIPGSAITTDVNQHDAHVRGIEAVVTAVPPGSPLSGYINFALNHGYANGPVTGGFFQLAQPNHTFDFDHDQRVSIVANLLYTFGRAYISTTGIYGTGLTNSYSPDTTAKTTVGKPGQPNYQPGSNLYCNGLLCFNSAFKVPPSYIQQWDLGYQFQLGRTTVRPDFYVDNAWDNHYALKGAFYSGPSIGRPRTFTGRVSVGI